MKYTFTAFAIIIFTSLSSYADDTDDAFKLCSAMERTGMTTGCEVNGRDVEVRMDTNGAEARNICAETAQEMSKMTSNFRGGKWKLKIFSPYSGEHPIAVCELY